MTDGHMFYVVCVLMPVCACVLWHRLMYRQPVRGWGAAVLQRLRAVLPELPPDRASHALWDVLRLGIRPRNPRFWRVGGRVATRWGGAAAWVCRFGGRNTASSRTFAALCSISLPARDA